MTPLEEKYYVFLADHLPQSFSVPLLKEILSQHPRDWPSPDLHINCWFWSFEHMVTYDLPGRGRTSVPTFLYNYVHHHTEYRLKVHTLCGVSRCVNPTHWGADPYVKLCRYLRNLPHETSEELMTTPMEEFYKKYAPSQSPKAFLKALKKTQPLICDRLGNATGNTSLLQDWL